MSQRTSGLGRTDVARCWAGFASLGAGLVHVAMIQEHLDHWLLAGVFFGVLAVVQIGWGLAALARDRAPFPRSFIVLNLTVVALWALSRTVGLPAGPDAGTAEAVGTSDVLAMVLHVLVVASLVVAMLTASDTEPAVPGKAPRVRQLRTGRALVVLAVGALVMAGLTTPALAASEAGTYARPHFSH